MTPTTTSETLLLLGAAVALVSLFFGLGFLAFLVVRWARQARREAKALRREVLTATRFTAKMLELVVRLDPGGTLGREASSMAAQVRAAEARIGAGVVTEGGRLPEPVEVIDPLTEEERWALDVEANDWRDRNDIPLPDHEKADAEALAKAVHARHERRK